MKEKKKGHSLWQLQDEFGEQSGASGASDHPFILVTLMFESGENTTGKNQMSITLRVKELKYREGENKKKEGVFLRA